MSPQEECDRDSRAHENNETPDVPWIHSLGGEHSNIPAGDGGYQHHQGLRPIDLARDDEQNNGDTIRRRTHQRSVGIHDVNVREAEQGPCREHQDSDGPAEIASIDGNKKLNDDNGDRADVERAFQDRRQARAENDEQRCGQQEPGDYRVKGSLRREKQKQRADDAAGQARNQQG